MKEIWKRLTEFPDYEVSNLGRIKSYKKHVNGYILKPDINKDGYYQVHLNNKDNKRCTKQIHRLVAITFIPNPKNLRDVNHKDENKLNNSIDNLEWCSVEYNCNYGTRNKRISESRLKNNIDYSYNIGAGNHKSRKIYCNELEKSWDCIADAARELGLNKKSLACNMKQHILGNRPANGCYNGIMLTWKYIN